MRRPLIKVCGVTRFEDAEFAYANGADIVGVVLSPVSPRTGSRELIHEMRMAEIPVAGVYTGLSEIKDELDDLQYVQLHYDHNASAIREIKRKFSGGIISVVNGESTDAAEKVAYYYRSGADIVMVEFRYGASANIDKIRELLSIAPIAIAGKISSVEVPTLMRLPVTMIDSSSRLESRVGVKDRSLVLKFIKAVHT